MIGKTLGQYHILEKLGAGGMGEVYLAHDQKLDREVAVKILPQSALADPSDRRRLRKEAQTLSRLNHPNIETLFDFVSSEGVEFLVVEYVGGLTLCDMLQKGPLPEREVARLGIQLADGVAAAHSQRIIHRDLKPSNLRISADGRLKILDFGIAKFLKPRRETIGTDGSTDSSTFQDAVGTLPYMAPEQLRAEAADARTDVYGVGVVLYEMATGQRPFREEAQHRLSDAILHMEPVPPRALNPRVSPELERIILKCLQKEPESRYQSTRELEVDLRQLATSAVVVKPLPLGAKVLHRLLSFSVVLALGVLVGVGTYIFNVHRHALDSLAVLPFSIAANDPESEYLSEGITDSLIDSLSQLPKLRVMARTTVHRIKARETDPQKVGKALGVRAVLTGRVSQRDGKLEVRADLVDVADGAELWGARYSRQISDLIAVQEEIAHEIASKLRLKLTPADQTALGKHYTQDSEAYQLYLKGRYYSDQYTLDGINRGIAYFSKAAQKDPGFALAHVGLADAYFGLSSQFLPPREALPKMAEAARKALEIDQSLAEAHTALALVELSYEYDFSGAEKEFQRAIDLNPGAEPAHEWYGYYLIAMGRQTEALRELHLAQEYDPLSPVVSGLIGAAIFSGRQYDRAIEQLDKALALEPNFWMVHRMLGASYTEEKRYGEARNEFTKAIQLGGGAWATADLGYLDAISGRKAEALRMLQRLLERSKKEYVSPRLVVAICVGLGQKDRAFEWIEKAYQNREEMVVFLKIEPQWDSLRSDPRFQDLLRRIGF